MNKLPKNWWSVLPLILLVGLGILLASLLGKSISIEHEYERQVRQEVRFCTSMLTYIAQEFLEHSDWEAFAKFCQEEFNPQSRFDTRVTVLQANGDVLCDSWKDAREMENHGQRPEFQKILQNPKGDDPYQTFERYSTTMQEVMFYSLESFQHDGQMYWIRCAIPKKSLESLAGRTQHNITLILILAISIASIIGFLLFRWFAYPTVQLLDATRQVAEGNLEARLPVIRRGALHEISNAINSMTEQLKRQIYQISHDKRVRDAIFSSLDEGVILLDMHGNILDINEAACGILDTTLRNAPGRPLSEIWRDRHWLTFFDGEKTEKTLHLKEEIALDFPLGQKQIRLTIQQIHWNPASSGFLLVLYDMTQLRKLENYRRDFIANVSHEIKTPLTVIMGAVESLQDGAMEDAKLAATFLETLAVHSRRLHALLQDVLSLSNLECQTCREDLPWEEHPIAEAAELAVALCQLAASQRKIRLEVDDQTNGKAIRYVPPLMEQVFVNLLDNAIKYSHEEGTIRIKIRENEAQKVEIRVEDQGIGIAAEHLPRIFERFYRADPSRDKATGGTGLGLAIVKHIVQLHGGKVSVESIPDQGTTFVVVL
ncbi:MAG: ATP-binding protein [Planctomycetia bacterium]|nr:ATP-binding protein [Planctomycetia bacterium]